jgi:hypothetical protein
MKYLLFVVLFVGVMITAGCVGNKETVVTPTPQIIYVTVTVTPTPIPIVVQAQDPIIGVWRFDGVYIDVRLRFNTDGTIESISGLKSEPRDIIAFNGTWSAQGGNLYIIKERISEIFIYDASRNVIYPKDYPNHIYTPYQGDIEAFSQAVSTPTYSSSQSSSGSTHFSGSGDDVKSFTSTGSGLRIFTMSHTGSHNFAVVLKDSGGNYMTLLANEIGSYSGKKSERLTSGTYYLDVTADGSWTIDISSM